MNKMTEMFTIEVRQTEEYATAIMIEAENEDEAIKLAKEEIEQYPLDQRRNTYEGVTTELTIIK